MEAKRDAEEASASAAELHSQSIDKDAPGAVFGACTTCYSGSRWTLHCSHRDCRLSAGGKDALCYKCRKTCIECKAIACNKKHCPDGERCKLCHEKKVARDRAVWVQSEKEHIRSQGFLTCDNDGDCKGKQRQRCECCRLMDELVSDDNDDDDEAPPKSRTVFTRFRFNVSFCTKQINENVLWGVQVRPERKKKARTRSFASSSSSSSSSSSTSSSARSSDEPHRRSHHDEDDASETKTVNKKRKAPSLQTTKHKQQYVVQVPSVPTEEGGVSSVALRIVTAANVEEAQRMGKDRFLQEDSNISDLVKLESDYNAETDLGPAMDACREAWMGIKAITLKTWLDQLSKGWVVVGHSSGD